MAKICVFCSSTNNLHQDYMDVARATGELLIKGNHHLIYGGSHRGLMGELSKSFAKYSNNLTEIIPKIWEDIAVRNGNTIVTKDLSERLQKMQSLSDAFITLPGGFGSLQETMDVLVAKQLKLHQKPLTIINTNGFYTPFITQLEKIINTGFAPKDNSQLFHVASTPGDALDYIKNYKPIEIGEK